MRITNCKKCGSSIHFIRTSRGWTPCDLKLINGREVQGSELIRENGQIAKHATSLDYGFICHFKTCTKRQERKRA